MYIFGLDNIILCLDVNMYNGMYDNCVTQWRFEMWRFEMYGSFIGKSEYYTISRCATAPVSW